LSSLPLVSVVIPAFDAERFIAVALSSLQAQSLQDWDAWIVDDGSTDRTLEIARTFAAGDPRFKVLTQANSGTPAVPRNRAIASSRGRFVSFLDPDDYYMPRKLERQLAVMQGFPEVEMVFSDNVLIDEAGHQNGQRYLQRVGYLGRARPHLEDAGAGVYVSRPSFFAFTSAEVAGPSTSGVMVRRTALERQGRWFAEDLAIGEDLDLWFRIIERGRVAFIDEPLNAYRQHSASLMNAGLLTARDSARAHVRNYARVRRRLDARQRRRYRERIASLFFDVGYQHRLAGRAASARVAYQRALCWRPELRTALAWLKTLVPPRTRAAAAHAEAAGERTRAGS
jgi:glycosyltransferase involved in cell wall biosynthesis